MTTALDHHPNGGKTQENTATQQNSDTEQDVQVSQPHVERAEGPFEHSGETSGWTEEEKKEKQEKEQDQP